QTYAVAGGGAVHVAVRATRDFEAHAEVSGVVVRKERSVARFNAAAAAGPSTGPSMRPLPPRTIRAPASATRRTLLRSPGSKRTAVPLGMSRRKPTAAPRSNRSEA